MDQDALTYDHKGRPPRKPAPGVVVWSLEKNGRRKRCELRDDLRYGAGVDVQVFDGDGFEFSQRCADRTAAQQLADSIRQDFERDGWQGR